MIITPVRVPEPPETREQRIFTAPSGTASDWLRFVNVESAIVLTHPALVVPLVLAGVGVSMAMPAVQNAVLSSVNVVEMAKASGVFNMGRFLGGMFGVALLVAVFSGTGAVGSAAAFSGGFGAAMMIASALSLLGAIAGLWLPARRRTVASEAARTA